MQLIFTPALGSTTAVAVVPGTVVQFVARVATRDYNDALAAGTSVELWGDIATGEWAATTFEPVVAAESTAAAVPANVLSLLPADPAPVPTTSAAPETTLLVANFVIPADIERADYQFTYRLAHSNDSGTWHTWLGDAGSNGHLVITQDAPPTQGLVCCPEWDSQSPAEGSVATFAGPVEWAGWALDLDSDSPSAPRRFSTLPKALTATHLALFPVPGSAALNPASHAPILLSTSSRLSIEDRVLSAHGAPIRVAPLSRAAIEASLPDHVVLLPEGAATAPFALVHDTRDTSLSILPTGPTPSGTQIISLDLNHAQNADAPKSLLFSSSTNKAALYTPGTRVAVPELGADVQVCDMYALGDDGRWEVGVVSGVVVTLEPEVEEEEASKVPPTIETRSIMQQLEAPPSPITPAEARFESPASKPSKLEAVPETQAEAEVEPALPDRAVTPRPGAAPPTKNKGILSFLQSIAAIVLYYATRGAWKVLRRLFGGPNSKVKVKVLAAKHEARTTPTTTTTEFVTEATPLKAAPKGDESESEGSSVNEVTPTPVESIRGVAVAVVDPSTSEILPAPPAIDTPGPATRKTQVNMPLTPPMSPKGSIPSVIRNLTSASKAKRAFSGPSKSTVFALSRVPGATTDELNVKVGGVQIPTAWDGVNVSADEGRTWVLEVEVNNVGRIEISLA